MYLQRAYLFFLCLAIVLNTIGWKPPGKHDIKRKEESDLSTEPPTEAHDHSDSMDVADLVIDTEHLMDDIGDMYSKRDFEKMGTDDKVFMWFNADDWDLDTFVDGSELLKTLSHNIIIIITLKKNKQTKKTLMLLHTIQKLQIKTN